MGNNDFYSFKQNSSQREKQEALFPLLNRLLIVLIIGSALALVLLTFYPEWKKLTTMRHDLAKDRDKLKALQSQATHREQELYLIQHDKEYLELIARDRLDLMKPNETIFRFSAPRGK